ncbi:MAG: flotillin [Verrucomicrobiales bacterium]|jgi:flotillin
MSELIEMLGGIGVVIVVVFLILVVGLFVLVVKCYRKVPQGLALVRTGQGGTQVSFTGKVVIPVFHQAEMINISVKRIEIDRAGDNGLICKDNMRADIKVAFFVRVNPTDADVKKVAQSIGCVRASDQKELEALFGAKFSEALKTIGKRFDFTELYEERDSFRDEIIKLIGTDLNGFSLEDAAIDDLEQTPLDSLDPNNILDSEGIKKITERTATQAKLANHIQRDKEKVIKQQDVEAREAILELERQLAETEAKQQREVDSVQAREQAETKKVQEENRQRAEQARIAADEEIQIAEQNKERQVIVALRNKERTDGVELERVERDRKLEEIDRERVTTLKSIEKEKAVEIEKKNIQDVIKERVAVEKMVVIEQEKIKDTEAFAGADREKQVAITLAEKTAQEAMLVKVRDAEAQKESAQLKADEEAYEHVKAAEASKQSAELHAQEIVITAEANQESAEKESAAKKMLAEGVTAETAAAGLGESQVIRAKANANAEGTEAQARAEAEGIRAKATADADGITEKAGAMKLFEEAGQGHEEFKLKLDKERQIDLAEIEAQKDIAAEQATVVAAALKTANIDIVGGESTFFDKITQAITAGKQVDRALDNSDTLTEIKDTLFRGDPDAFKAQIREWVDMFGISSEDLKNLTVAAVLGKMLAANNDSTTGRTLNGLLGAAQRLGVADQKANKVL